MSVLLRSHSQLVVKIMTLWGLTALKCLDFFYVSKVVLCLNFMLLCKKIRDRKKNVHILSNGSAIKINQNIKKTCEYFTGLPVFQHCLRYEEFDGIFFR